LPWPKKIAGMVGEGIRNSSQKLIQLGL